MSIESTKKIPNYNTFSTLIDRLSIENVKLSHFENAVENDPLDATQKDSFLRKIEVQRMIIGELKHELRLFLEEVFLKGDYSYMDEERTFV